MNGKRFGIAGAAVVLAVAACSKDKSNDAPGIRPLTTAETTAAKATATAVNTVAALAPAPAPPPPPASPYPPDPDCANGRPALDPRLGPVRHLEEIDKCGPGDVCGYFLLMATASGCQDGGDSAGAYAKRKLEERSITDAQLVVFIDRHGRRGAGAMFKDDDRKQEVNKLLGLKTAGIFPGLTVWRTYPAVTATPQPPAEPDQTTKALKTARASTNLRDNAPDGAFDNQDNTAWCEAKAGDGTGEWLEAEIEPGFTVSAVDVTGGWAYESPTAAEIRHDRGDMWELSNVVTKLKVEWDGGSEIVTFERATDRGVRKRVAVNAATKTIRFTIERVSRGNAGDNACLAGFKIYGK